MLLLVVTTLCSTILHLWLLLYAICKQQRCWKLSTFSMPSFNIFLIVTTGSWMVTWKASFLWWFLFTNEQRWCYLLRAKRICHYIYKYIYIYISSNIYIYIYMYTYLYIHIYTSERNSVVEGWNSTNANFL